MASEGSASSSGMATTICLVGFPSDGGVTPRELKNLCRFMHGFEGAHVAFGGNGAPSALFVKFTTHEIAALAMEQLHGADFDPDSSQFTLKAEYARREMEVRPNSPLPTTLAAAPGVPPQQQQWPAQQMVARPAQNYGCCGGMGGGMHGPGSFPHNGGAMMGGRRIGATGGELVTLAVVALKEKGVSPDDLQSWFQMRPGFVSQQLNDRIGGLFIRFSSAAEAEQALQDANEAGIKAEWARRNLDDERSAGAGGCGGCGLLGGGPAMGCGGCGGHGMRRQGMTGGELVTIVVLHVETKPTPLPEMQEFFKTCPGFDRFQLNERIGGLFIKFLTPEDAEFAMNEANQRGYGAEWARRNLDDSPAPAFGGGMMQGGMMNMGHGMGCMGGGMGCMGGMGGGMGCMGGMGGGMGCMGGMGGGMGCMGGMGGMGPPSKRMRPMGGEIDTITILNLRDKERSIGSNLRQWFLERPGYYALQINEKIDAMFVKFASRNFAEQAIREANAMWNVGAEFSRRNLDL